MEHVSLLPLVQEEESSEPHDKMDLTLSNSVSTQHDN